MRWYADKESWRFILRAYLPRLLVGNFIWEIAQLPLYTLWESAYLKPIIFAVIHCTAGDVLIGASAVIGALLLLRAPCRKDWHTKRIVALTIGIGLAYTTLSEQFNLAQGNWAYAAAMPVVPWLEVGLAPLLQWLLVPAAAWWCANQTSSLHSARAN